MPELGDLLVGVIGIATSAILAVSLWVQHKRDQTYAALAKLVANMKGDVDEVAAHAAALAKDARRNQPIVVQPVAAGSGNAGVSAPTE